jgi:hypothetical protein
MKVLHLMNAKKGTRGSTKTSYRPWRSLGSVWWRWTVCHWLGPCHGILRFCRSAESARPPPLRWSWISGTTVAVKSKIVYHRLRWSWISGATVAIKSEIVYHRHFPTEIDCTAPTGISEFRKGFVRVYPISHKWAIFISYLLLAQSVEFIGSFNLPSGMVGISHWSDHPRGRGRTGL